MRLALFLAALIVVAAACSSGPRTSPSVTSGSSSPAQARVLHLRGIDIGESRFTIYINQLLSHPSAKTLCDGLKGLPDQEIVDTLTSLGIPPGVTVVPGQASKQTDAIRAAGIIRTACESISP